MNKNFNITDLINKRFETNIPGLKDLHFDPYSDLCMIYENIFDPELKLGGATLSSTPKPAENFNKLD